MSAAPDHVGQIVYTIFPSTSAQKKYELSETWPEIVQRIKVPTEAAEKSALPLISMGTYGNTRSAKNALRHAANLLAVTGVEGDYDGKVMPMEDAAERIGLAGIKAALYTSPSHTADAPRWRILAPLSREHLPADRARFLARLNGILGGILAGESFTLSQTYYIGRVEGVEYQWLEVDGDCIDLRDEFDQTAIMPAGKTTDDGGQHDSTTDDDLREGIRSGRSFHEALRSLSARMIGRGMAADDVSAVLHGLMAESVEKDSPRWRERLQEIPRLVESAAAKFRDPRQADDGPAPPDDGQFAPFEVIAGDQGEPIGPAGMDDNKAPPETQRFNRLAARVGLETFDCPPSPPEHIVQDYTLRNVGVSVGPGGGGKSTLTIYEAVHIVLGRSLFGREIMRPGPVLILTAEDEREIVRWRLFRMVQDMQLSRPEVEHVAKHIHVEDAVSFPCRFVDVDPGGRLVRTKVLDEIADEYGPVRLSAIYADPQNAFGPGERFVNDGEGELMRAGAWLSSKLNCAVRFTHHVGKANARSGTTDQYSGRGGSAGADNARFVHNLVTHLADGDGFTAPTGATPQDIAEGRLLRLHVAKLSHGKRPTAPIWLLREGFTFRHLKPTVTDPEVVERDRLRRLHGFVQAQATSGIRHTRTSLEDRLGDLSMSRGELRSTLHIAMQRGHLSESELPEGERVGARKTYLSAGSHP